MTLVNCHVQHRLGNVILSVLIIVGMVFSYAPQHVRIVRLGSSHGLSPYYLLMGALGSYSNVLNALLLQAPYMGCCRLAEVSTSQCVLNLVGFAQLLTQWAMFFIIFALFIWYFPEDEKYVQASREGEVARKASSEWRMTLSIAILVIAYMAATGTLAAVLLVATGSASATVRPPVIERAAWLLGLTSLSLSLLQFLPQLHRTWRLKRPGALSIPAMCMQAPGSFVFCYTLAIAPGTNASTWIAYFAGGTLQSALLILCLYYTYKTDREYEHGYIRVEAGNARRDPCGEEATVGSKTISKREGRNVVSEAGDDE